MVFCNICATELNVLLRLEFGNEVDELGAIAGKFSGEVN